MGISAIESIAFPAFAPCLAGIIAAMILLTIGKKIKVAAIILVIVSALSLNPAGIAAAIIAFCIKSSNDSNVEQVQPAQELKYDKLEKKAHLSEGYRGKYGYQCRDRLDFYGDCQHGFCGISNGAG